MQSDAFDAVVGQQERAGGGVVGEEVEDDLLFAGPGVGEDEIEVVGLEVEVVVGDGAGGREPGEVVGGADGYFGAVGDEAAADEFGVDVVVGGQFVGDFDERRFDFDADGVEAELRGEAGDDADAAAPFEEAAAGGEVGCDELRLGAR